ncbi:6716_t:CDS:2, partial [Dentiscutata erythropus]
MLDFLFNRMNVLRKKENGLRKIIEYPLELSATYERKVCIEESQDSASPSQENGLRTKHRRDNCPLQDLTHRRKKMGLGQLLNTHSASPSQDLTHRRKKTGLGQSRRDNCPSQDLTHRRKKMGLGQVHVSH